MSQSDRFRETVFKMVADGEIDIDAAMALLARTDDLAAELSARKDEASPIAVIGMAGRYGHARDLESLWSLLEAGENGFGSMPERRWPAAEAAGRQGSFLPDEDRFDPLFFRISPTEAALMDPQQRLFLETAYHALEDAGYADTALSGTKCGVFAGVGAGDYAQRFRDRGLESNPFGLMGNVTSILAARISYFLNLKGPSIALDTACSSSLVAVHLACESLRAGTSDMALAGGVAVISTPNFLGAMTEGGMLSPTNRCRPFDAAGDGFVCGEGVGVVTLKRLADAVRDGDMIHGVIRASGINQDGHTNGITAPSAPSQTSLIVDVLERARIDPDTVSYVETHGTGTALGDPIEFEALTSAFSRFTGRRGFCALGSAKANIGHTLTAAGVAGLLKVLLMMRHKTIPPLADFEAENPRIDIEHSPFRVPREAEPWQGAGARRAAVSSFGFSGTNAHLIVEEAPARPVRSPATGPFLILLSARSDAALRDRARDLADHLTRGTPDLRDVAFTLAVGRTHHPHRLALVAGEAESLSAALEAWLAGARDPSVLAGTPDGEGPGPALVAFAKEAAQKRPSTDSLRVLGDLYVQGVSIDFAVAAAFEGGRRVSLPGTPFERVACTIEGAIPAPPPPDAAPTPVEARNHAPEGDPMEALAAALGDRATPDLSAKAEAFQNVEAWGRRALVGAFAALGLFERRVYTVAGLMKALGVAGDKRRLYGALLDILIREQVIAREGDVIRVVAEPDRSTLGAERQRLAGEEPELAPFLTLLAACIEGLPQLITGQTSATEIMFPDGRMDLVEPIYRGSRLAEHFNGLIADAAATLASRSDRPLRILEIGAGTGGATVGILDALRHRGLEADYTFTDISQGFVQQARPQFGAANPAMNFAALDIERDPLSQGFAPAGYDLVIASNVLHACRRIDRALAHTGALLRKGGLVLLNEVTALQDYATLTFGLTDGWWAFEDADVRIDNAPLLSVDGWRGALNAAAFPAAHVFGLPSESGHTLSQAVIAAAYEGEPAMAPAPTPAPSVPAQSAVPGERPSMGELERVLAAEVSSVLGLPVERIDPRGRFMDYGIDSILGGQLIARLNARLSLALRPTVVFDHPSIRDLARHITTAHGDALTLPANALSGAGASAPSGVGESAPSGAALKAPSGEALKAPSGEALNAPAGMALEPQRAQPHAPAAAAAMAAPATAPAAAAARDGRIAVIGMSGRFADCANLDEFHAMLAEGRSGITDVPRDRWSADPSTLPDGVASQAAYLRRGGFLKNAGDFDPLFFRISGKEAELTDPQHRLFLTEAWRALEDAGYAEDELDGMRCGVFVGAHGGDYTHRMTEVGIVPEAFAFMGNAAAILAARIAYTLNLKGPSIAVDTACSSSLTAIHTACRSLLDGDCTMALAGGVFLTTTLGFNTAAAKAGMLSPVGECKTFDRDADGFVPGEGVGVIVLKPYADAVRDGDHIDAVILASAINQDGRTNGITAPSPQSQAALEAEAYDKAGISADAISYVEAHGTGTPLGDPIEIQGLTRAFRQFTDRTGFCAIGSVKTNIGHAAHAAGIAGVLKVLLSLKHRVLYPSLNFRAENPELRLAETPFRVTTALTPWEPSMPPRIAAVSSFGFSGTNVHIVLAEPDRLPARSPADPAPHIVTLSARTPAALAKQRTALREALDAADVALVDVSRTLNAGRCHFEHRFAAVVSDIAGLKTALETPEAGVPVAAGAPVDTTKGAAPALMTIARAYLAGEPLPPEAIPADGRRISLPTYPFEPRRYWLDEPGFDPSATSPVPRANYFVPRWEAEPAERQAPRGTVWFVSADGPVADIAEAWRNAGASAVEVDAADLLALRRRSGTPDAVVVLGMAPPMPATMEGGAKTVFTVLQALFSDAIPVLYVHRGEPAQASVQAFRRSVWFDGAQPDVRLLALEGPPLSPGALAEAIAAELAVPPGAPGETRRSARGRLVRRMVPADPPGAASPVAAASVREGAHILITGGGGRLAALFAERLARTFGAKISLIGRSPASGVTEATLSEIPGAIHRQADVCNHAALANAVAEARAIHGPIHGVIHAAGVPAGPLLRDAHWADIAQCLAPKVEGTLTLDAVLADEPLDFFVLFASLAGELGDFGQAAYALANAFCDRFAHARQQRGGLTVALDWPLWRDGRRVMSAEGEKVLLTSSGIPYLEADAGWQAFLDALALREPQLAVVPGAAEAACAMFAPPPHGVTPRAPQPAMDAAKPVAGADRHAAIVRDLTRLISEQLKIDEDLLSPGAGLADFGFDSIALKEFAERLGAAYGITLNPAVFFAHGTIEALATHLAESHGEAVAARHASAEPRKTAPPKPPAAARAAVEPVPATPRSNAIAIIGMSGRFPGAPDLARFWQQLEGEHDLVGPLPEGRTLAGDGPHKDRIVAGFLDRIDTFDNAFFKVTAREACFLDPQHRLAIEETWHAVEDAGLKMSALAGRSIGVFFGPQVNEYGGMVPDLDVARAQIALGNIATMLPNRISYLFDLRGPSEAIDTACSSSLVAVHRAVRALQAGECEMALAGGVSLVLTAQSIASTMELGVISPDGRCHSFDKRANGYVKGEGVGVVLLKPLDKAVADGDPIQAVILGSAENHGGRAHSLTAPNGTAQAALIASAIRAAGVPSDTIGYVEAHGTGTDLGDPVEVLALAEAFGATAEPGTVAAPACGLGTVKTNIGHLEPASGIAGLIKTCLALKHQVLPASLHFDEPNPLIDFESTPFHVVDETRPWVRLADAAGEALPRRAGVSSFGLGGSNVHVVVEEAAMPEPAPACTAPQLFLVTARDRERLGALLRRLADALRDRANVDAGDVAHTLAVGREMMNERAAILWRPGEALADRFDAAVDALTTGRDQDGVWSGTVAKGGLGGDDPERGRQLMRDLFESGQFGRLSVLWVNGADLPDGITFGRRIPLPGYPFAPTRCWFDRNANPSEAVATAPPSAPAAPAVVAAAPPVPPIQSASVSAEPAPVPTPAEPAPPLAADPPPAGDVGATVRREVARMLYLDEDQLDDTAAFTELGLDSILAVELTKALNEILGTDLQATRLYDYGNVAELSGYLQQTLAEGASPAPTPVLSPASSPAPAPAPAAASASPVVAAPAPASALSQEEVRAVVRRQLARAIYLDEADLDDNLGLEDLGLDSILAVELAKSLQDELGIAFQAPRLYDYATIAELSGFLHAELSARQESPVAASSPALVFLTERLAAFGFTDLSPTTRLDTIALTPANAKAVLAEVNARFGCTLGESDVGRCRDLAALAAAVSAKASGDNARSPEPAAQAPRPHSLSAAAPAVMDAPPVQPAPMLQQPAEPAAAPAPAPAPAPVTALAEPDVAIIGYDCRLPGAPNAAAFWDQLVSGTVAVAPEPEEAWRRRAYRDALNAVGSDATPWGGYLDRVDCFDAGFFHITPHQARLMDPLQRLVLEAAWHAFEAAGQDRSPLKGASCGVFIGGGPSDYARLLEAHPDSVNGEALLGNTASVLAARVAYFLDLRGPSVAMDTACSSGLVALHAAWRSIRSGECDMALVGGVNLMLTPQMHVLTGAGGMLSPGGACKSFADDADGFVPAEGVVTLVLKRLDRALADNDPVHGVIRGIGVNHNGTTAGLSAPSARSQARLLGDLYARYGIEPADIGLVEAHGTGTKIGDALEFDALREVFAKAGARPAGTVLGSAKPLIGHAFAASGLASVVKLLLAMRHRAIPPTMAPGTLNEHMALAGSPFRINGALEPWPAPATGPRMAATTAYGLSGTNAHVVLAEPPERVRLSPPAGGAHLVVLSAPDDAALRRQVDALRTALEAGAPGIADLAYTLARRRTHFSRRAAFIVRDCDDLTVQLAAWPTVPWPAGDGARREAAETYLAGGTVDWAAVVPDAAVCALPGYRFADDRYFIGDAPALTDASPARPTDADGGDMIRLRDLLAEILRVAPDQLAPDATFEALGIDSASAIALMRSAEMAFGVAVPPLALWDHPTLRDLAAFIAAQPKVARTAPPLALAGLTPSGTHDPLVPVRTEGAGRASFWVHGGPGDVNWVPEIARHLDADHPVFAFEAQGLDGIAPPLPTVEAMAAHYVAALRQTGPGPYVLGAYSGGGVIAFEMTRQLAAVGETVERLFLLDANAPGRAGPYDIQAAFGPGYIYLVVANWLGARWGATTPLRFADFDGLDKPAMLDTAVAHLFAQASPPMAEPDVRRQIEALDRIGWAIGDALRAYQPARLPVAVPVTLFACLGGMAGGDNPLGLPHVPAAEAYREGWDDLVAGPIEEIALPCDHFGLLSGETGHTVARMINDRLAPASSPAPADDVTALVLSLVREILPDVAADAVTPDRSMSELGATSIDRVEVATLAMERLAITVPHQDLASVDTIGGLIDVLGRHLAHA